MLGLRSAPTTHSLQLLFSDNFAENYVNQCLGSDLSKFSIWVFAGIFGSKLVDWNLRLKRSLLDLLLDSSNDCWGSFGRLKLAFPAWPMASWRRWFWSCCCSTRHALQPAMLFNPPCSSTRHALQPAMLFTEQCSSTGRYASQLGSGNEICWWKNWWSPLYNWGCL